MANPSPRRERLPRPRPEPLADCFHRIVCPLCNGPMTARVGRHGPYFHCACRARPHADGNPGNGTPEK
jgi:hypothetical protein